VFDGAAGTKDALPSRTDGGRVSELVELCALGFDDPGRRRFWSLLGFRPSRDPSAEGDRANKPPMLDMAFAIEDSGEGVSTGEARSLETPSGFSRGFPTWGVVGLDTDTFGGTDAGKSPGVEWGTTTLRP
jgi:hypothetical protein